MSILDFSISLMQRREITLINQFKIKYKALNFAVGLITTMISILTSCMTNTEILKDRYPEVNKKFEKPIYILENESESKYFKIEIDFNKTNLLVDFNNFFSQSKTCDWEIGTERSRRNFLAMCGNKWKWITFIDNADILEELRESKKNNSFSIYSPFIKYVELMRKDQISILKICDSNECRNNLKLHVYTHDENLAGKLIGNSQNSSVTKNEDLILLRQLNDFNIDEFKPEEGDNSIQIEEKKKERSRIFKQHLQKMRGKVITFKNLEVRHIEQEEVLTEIGKQKLKKDEDTFRKDLSIYGSEVAFNRAFNSAIISNCIECKRKIESYIVNYRLIDPTSVQDYGTLVTVQVRYKTKNDIIKLKEGEIISVTGKIVSFEYPEYIFQYNDNSSIDINDLKIQNIFLDYNGK